MGEWPCGCTIDQICIRLVVGGSHRTITWVVVVANRHLVATLRR